jgi:hypothetical protein
LYLNSHGIGNNFRKSETICQIPGVSAIITIPGPGASTVYDRQIPDPRELSIRKIPGGVSGGGGGGGVGGGGGGGGGDGFSRN